MDSSSQHTTTFSQPSKSTSSAGDAPSTSHVRRPLQTAVVSLTALPLSSPLVEHDHPIQESSQGNHVPLPNTHKPSSSPIPPQLTSGNSRGSTPTVRKKSSLGSIQSPPHAPLMRRTSSTLAPSSHTSTMRKTPPVDDSQPPQMTAAHLARLFFQEDIKAHETAASFQGAELAIILHDACYGHRYARPRTSKANLSTIVERPERIRATVMGLAAAYVRLGERHAEGQYPPQAPRLPQLPVPFTILKSSRHVPLIASAVTHVHGLKWMQELSTMCRDAGSKLASNGKELARSNSESNGIPSVEKAKLHEGDLYLCSESLDALEGSLGAICDAVDQVFGSSITKRTFVSIRPPGHHCSADYPSGFCWINNVHVGISHAAQTHGLTHAAIIDFDLHHGDGSQTITWAHNAAALRLPKNAPAFKKASIGYFSLHDINSYPCEYGAEEKVQNASLCIENAHGQTIWNVHLQPWKKESDFWHLYDTRYSVLLEKARTFLLHHSLKRRQSASQLQPKAAIFISAGFDASEWEGSGMQRHKVNVPTEFYARFTRDIVKLANEDGLGVDGRVISVLEGGYSDRALSSGVLGHICGLASSKKLDHMGPESHSLSHEIAARHRGLKLEEANNQSFDTSKWSPAPYESHWWSPKCLEELENPGKVPQAAAPAKRQSNGVAPTYTTPTQSSTAKAISPLQPRRSMSASTATTLQLSSSNASSRQPTPPPPEIDWATATQELFNVLIPTNRSTMSHRHEELNAQATRARKDRQSILVSVDEAQTLDGKRMQLRDRKSKAPQPKITERETTSVAKPNRRKTIADATLLVPESLEDDTIFKPVARAATKALIRRRSSVASSAISTIEEHQSTMPCALSRSEASRVDEKMPGIPLESCLGSVNSDKNDVLIAKKTRQISNAGATAPRSKKTAVERPHPVPRVLSTNAKGDSIQPADPTLHNQNGLPSRPSQSTAVTDVDSLVSGIKKINLKLNPPKKPDQETLTGTKKPAAKAPRKAAESKAHKVVTKQANVVNAPPSGSSVAAISPQAHQVEVAEREYPDSANTTAPTTQAIPFQSEDANSQAPIPHQPLTGSHSITPSFMAPTAPAISATASGIENSLPFATANDKESILPPMSLVTNPVAPLTAIVNHQVTSPKRTRAELPIFTSTSPIMFAPQNRESTSMNEMMHQNPEAGHGEGVEAPTLARKDVTFPVPGDEKVGQPFASHEGDPLAIPDTPRGNR